ncbi:GNAT family N-acetyltransferase [uncultured Dubosiella sp.]|uniref:GNAT family N-acetyltransferase n=1 Tax=uncultured Dubosiella sp. TaxID=1937011 RepID=UPI0025B28FAC|nr:GNAT family N-acetyltransferase [uncultured Dubosiella sp.]
MRIVQLQDPPAIRAVTRTVLETLTEWFEDETAREQYIEQSGEQVVFAAFQKERPIGFVCLRSTGKDTVELAVMGVLGVYHGQGVGSRLVERARVWAKENGYSFMQVKTVRMGVYESYDRTNRFYQKLGFKEFEVMPALWDEWNPCQIYIMSVG